MKIEQMKIGDLRPYENNPRNNKDSVKSVASSIKEFGFQQPIVVDSDRVIIIGHTRLLAAKKLGMKKVPVHVAGDLDKAQIKALRLADNKVAEQSFWDTDMLRDEIKDLAEIGEFDMESFGFADHELKSIFDSDDDDDDEEMDLDSMEQEPGGEKPTAQPAIRIKFDDLQEKAEAYNILGLDVNKKTITWADLKDALNM